MNAQFQAVVRGETHSGPLPHPDILRQYAELIEHGADRIMRMAEQQAEHRMKQEDRVVRANVRAQTMGQIFGFILGLIGLIGGLVLVFRGRDISGFVLMLGALASLAGVFISGKKRQTKELAQKRQLPNG